MAKTSDSACRRTKFLSVGLKRGNSETELRGFKERIVAKVNRHVVDAAAGRDEKKQMAASKSLPDNWRVRKAQIREGIERLVGLLATSVELRNTCAGGEEKPGENNRS